jgi:hypothetical protein
MQRLKLSFLIFSWSFVLSFGFATSAVGAGGTPGTGGAPGVGGAASVRRHVGTIVQGTSYLTYVSYLCLALVGFGIIGMQVDKTRSETRRNHD